MQRIQRPGRKCLIGFLAVALGYILLTGIGVHFTKGTNAAEVSENQQWVASGRFWVDRQWCNWFGMCGIFHYFNSGAWTWEKAADGIPKQIPDSSQFWTSGPEDPDAWSPEERETRKIPQYVLEHAPYVHLFSGENYWPGDLADHLTHTTPYLNYSIIQEMENDRNLTNLNELNDHEEGRSGRFIYLQSDDNVEERPRWLGGVDNIPNVPDRLPDYDNYAPWPDLGDLGDFDLAAAKQQALEGHFQETDTDFPYPTIPSRRTPSPNGRCGGNSGFTCEGSKSGGCCSIYGWCGRGDEYCGGACDALAGKCDNPLKPNRPHRDLRKRNRDFSGNRHRPNPAGKSSAPAILVVVPKEDGIVDAFWFFFYSYNLGNKVFNIRFGNHVGDWEHTAIRFRHGEPESVFLSEHDFGDAYSWHAMEKYIPNPAGDGTMLGTWANHTAARVAKRPVIYSATGSHAMYGTPGLHPYVLPLGILHDQTDRGPLWDPSLNIQSYTYNATSHVLRSSTLNPLSPTGWFHYAGHWGDKYYPLSDPRQYRFAGQYHFVNGPTGPKFKNLGRKDVCQGKRECHIRHWLSGHKGAGHLPEEEGNDAEEGGLPGGNSTDV